MSFYQRVAPIKRILFKQFDGTPQRSYLIPSSFSVSLHFTNSLLKMDEMSLSLMSRQLAPSLDQGRHKGQAGRIGIFGGSLEYTGAPYFAGITAMKVGADLVHVFCSRDAAPVIKSYSPDFIVHPLLDVEGAVEKIEPWLERLHLLIIGPGLGREPSTLQVIEGIIAIGKRMQKSFVIDADGLFLIAEKPEILNNFPAPGVIITPNVMEYGRIFGLNASVNLTEAKVKTRFEQWGNYVTVLRKGKEDVLMDYSKQLSLSLGGSGRRCGGQGDMISGALGVFFAWALLHKLDVSVPHDDRAMIACYAACKLIRECNANAFKRLGRSMTTTDMIHEIHGVFDKFFETK